MHFVIISFILTIITPLYADNHEVCGICDIGGNDCDTGETCQDLGDGLGRCYWEDDSIINIGEFDRTCSNDFDCRTFNEPHPEEAIDNDLWYFGQPYDSFAYQIEDFNIPNACMRCCSSSNPNTNLCTETISRKLEGEENCGVIHGRQVFSSDPSEGGPNAYAFNLAPCCPGETCFDNILGVCGVPVQECGECIAWNSPRQEFVDVSNKLNDCAEGLICLTMTMDDGVDFDDYDYFSYTYTEEQFSVNSPFSVSLERDFVFSGIKPDVNVQRGICVPEDGFSKNISTCEIDENCPSCMRCCDVLGDGNKKCVRSSGDICGLTFAGRGPCCCPEYTCKSNMCMTKAPTESPTPAPTGDDSDSNDQFFAAADVLGLNEGNDNKYTSQLVIHTDISLVWCIILLVIIVILLVILGCFCSYKNKPQVSFKTDAHVSNV